MSHETEFAERSELVASLNAVTSRNMRISQLGAELRRRTKVLIDQDSYIEMVNKWLLFEELGSNDFEDYGPPGKFNKSIVNEV